MGASDGVDEGASDGVDEGASDGVDKGASDGVDQEKMLQTYHLLCLPNALWSSKVCLVLYIITLHTFHYILH